MSDHEIDRDLFIRYMLLAVAVLQGVQHVARRAFPHLEAGLADMEDAACGFLGDAHDRPVIDIVDGRVVALDWARQ